MDTGNHSQSIHWILWCILHGRVSRKPTLPNKLTGFMQLSKHEVHQSAWKLRYCEVTMSTAEKTNQSCQICRGHWITSHTHTHKFVRKSNIHKQDIIIQFVPWTWLLCVLFFVFSVDCHSYLIIWMFLLHTNVLLCSFILYKHPYVVRKKWNVLICFTCWSDLFLSKWTLLGKKLKVDQSDIQKSQG